MRKVRKRRQNRCLIAAVAAIAIVLAGCGSGDSGSSGGSASDGTPQHGGTATIDWVANPTSLDPLRYNVLGTYNIVSLVYSSLYRWNEDGTLSNDLATAAPEVSKDGLTVTIPIRDDVTWHDGSALTAKDVVFTIENVIEPENASIWLGPLSPITEAEATDDTTVTLTLSRPYDALQGMLAQVPVISSAKEYVPTETYARTMNGTGPFTFVEWKQGIEVTLERNDDYYVDELPYLDGIVVKTVTEDAARMANVASRASDLMPMVPFNQIDTLKSRNVNVEITPRSAQLPLLFPSMKEGRPTADVDFRKAVAWAIDRGKIVSSVYKGVAEPASTVLANGTDHWDEELGTTYGDTADLDEARAALERSGVEKGTKIELIVRNEPLSIASGTIIQANLNDLGLDVSLSPQESASYLPALMSGDFDLMMLGVEAGLSSGFTPVYAFSALHSESGANYTGFEDAELDKRLLEAVGSPEDPDAAWRAVQERELEVVPLIPTVTARYVEAFSTRLKGHTPSSLFSVRDLDQAWIEE